MNPRTLLVPEGANNLPYHHMLPKGMYRPVDSRLHPCVEHEDEQALQRGLHLDYKPSHPSGGILLPQPASQSCQGVSVQPRPLPGRRVLGHVRNQPRIQGSAGPCRMPRPPALFQQRTLPPVVYGPSTAEYSSCSCCSSCGCRRR